MFEETKMCRFVCNNYFTSNHVRGSHIDSVCRELSQRLQITDTVVTHYTDGIRIIRKLLMFLNDRLVEMEYNLFLAQS